MGLLQEILQVLVIHVATCPTSVNTVVVSIKGQVLYITYKPIRNVRISSAFCSLGQFFAKLVPVFVKITLIVYCTVSELVT